MTTIDPRQPQRGEKHSERMYSVAGGAIIAVAAAFIYGGTLDSSFHLDDFRTIVDNPSIRSLGDPAAILGYLPQRAIGMLSFALNYRLGGLDVTGYHILNIIIHIISSLMAWRLALAVLSTPAVQGVCARNRTTAALAAGLIFAVHPLQTQAVTYIVQRFTSLAALFYMASVLAYLTGRMRLSGKARWYVLSAITGVAGMFTKEVTVTLPATIALCEAMLFDADPLRASGAGRKKAVMFALMAAAAAVLLLAPLSFNPLHFFSRAVSQRHGDGMLTSWMYFTTQFRVIPRYILLLFIPLGQSIDHDIPASTNLLNPLTTLAGLVFIAALIAAAVRLRKRYPLVTFGVAWWFVTIAVESSFKPLGNVMFEHRLYLPMFGFSLALATVVLDAVGTRSFRAAVAALTAIAVVFGGLTVARNRVWRNDISLWSDAADKSPKKARPQFQLAEAYDHGGEVQLSRECYERALAAYPNYIEAHNNLGELLIRSGDTEGARSHFERAIDLDPNYPSALTNLGTLLHREGDTAGAERYYRQAIRLDTQNGMALNNLGIIFLTGGNADSASVYFRRAFDADPLYVNAAVNLARVLISTGRHSEAVDVMRQAVKTAPDDPSVLLALGTALHRNGDLDEAERLLSRAVSVAPGNIAVRKTLAALYVDRGENGNAIEQLTHAVTLSDWDTHYRLGMLYQQENALRNAITHYTRALELNPALADAHLRLAVCYRQLGDTAKADEHSRSAMTIMRERSGPPSGKQ